MNKTVAMPPRKMSGHQKFMKLTKADEHSIYRILVSYGKDNPIHESVLFTGFKSGVGHYIPDSEEFMGFAHVYWVEIREKLADIPRRSTIDESELLKEVGND